MKKILSWCLLSLLAYRAGASGRDSTTYFPLPDSVKAVTYLADIRIANLDPGEYFFAGITTDAVSLHIQRKKGKGMIWFNYPTHSAAMARAEGVSVRPKGTMDFACDIQPGETCKLLIATTSDSAGNFSLYSGYAWLPQTGKWKLIGTVRINGRWNTLQQPAFVSSRNRKTGNEARIAQAWCQRTNGSWKNLLAEEKPIPVINYTGHVDSLAQSVAETRQIEDSIAAGMSNLVSSPDGIYYTILQEGTGMPVNLTDTVTVFYKGWLFADGTVFDQTKEKPATFPLKRLIRGWQVGLPLCHTGAKIRLVIPSGLAYSIRTRAAKIPPNSILVFDIEVVDTKPGK